MVVTDGVDGVASATDDDEDKYTRRAPPLRRLLQRLLPSVFAPALPVVNRCVGWAGQVCACVWGGAGQRVRRGGGGGGAVTCSRGAGGLLAAVNRLVGGARRVRACTKCVCRKPLAGHVASPWGLPGVCMPRSRDKYEAPTPARLRA